MFPNENYSELFYQQVEHESQFCLFGSKGANIDLEVVGMFCTYLSSERCG